MGILDAPRVVPALQSCRPITVPTHSAIPVIRYETGLPKEALEASIAQRRPPTERRAADRRARSTSSPAPGARTRARGRGSVGAQALVEQAAAGLRADRRAAAAGPPTRAAPDAASRILRLSPHADLARHRRRPPLARDRAGRERARPGQPEPARRRGRRARRQGARRGLPRRLRRRRTPSARRSPPAPTTRAAATLYVSLEPCCHHGQTPPCTDAILEAGIRRVVVGSDDPTEKASGRGLGILRDEGVEVVVADGEPAFRARLLNQAFRKHARTGRPHVLFKSAMTLDGKVATRTGDSKWISGEEARLLSHHWRAERDAVVVGIGTALADDPQLDARIPGVRAPAAPRRVRLRGPAAADSQLVRGAPALPLTVVVGRAASRLQTDALEAAGADVIVATGENEPARVRSALDQLGAAGVTSILLEGGPKLAGAFLDAGELDELRLFLAPVVARRLERARPARGRGRRADRRGDPRARARRRADRRRRADLRAAAGSGDAVHRAGPGPRERSRRWTPPATASRSACARGWRARSPRATRSRSTASA